ncbi:MAG: radical SAM protein [Planctomycetes bacterium]|nr:radical SAM protein [Planctomycetota bacterium]
MPTHQLHTTHERSFDDTRYVYPVLSRRSGGMSIGVNLNPDKVCNFDCIYCQVDRREQSETTFVGMDRLLEELRELLPRVATGKIFQAEKFRDTPKELRRLNDIAFSGDGEPTTYKNFDEIIAACAEVKRAAGLDDVKMVLITNASMLHRSHVQRGLEILDANQGEIWAKLDAGTAEYYQQIERTPIPFQQILDNITSAAQVRSLVIQSLFMRVDGKPPTANELEAFCDRLAEIVSAGGQLSLVQIYTVARRPAESFVSPLSNAEVDAIVEQVCSQAGVPAKAYYGS